MKKGKLPADAEIAAWMRMELAGELTPTQARGLLELHFSQQDLDRMRELSAKARAGSLTPEEAAQADAYERFSCVLDILHSKARRAIQRRRPAS